MKSKSDPEGKPSQIHAPHMGHGWSVAVWVSPKYYDPHFQEGDWETGPRFPELEFADLGCAPRHYHRPHDTEERLEVCNLEKVIPQQEAGGRWDGC